MNHILKFRPFLVQNQRLSHHPARFFKIYTKTGDKGTSALYTGDRLGKDDMIFQSLGSIDEINANLGLAREHCLSIPNLNSKYHA